MADTNPTPAVTKASITMVLWLDDEEFDEIEEATRIICEKFPPERVPHIAAKIVKGGTGDDFILAIDEALAENPFAQAAFLSAHGTKEGLHLHRKQPDPMVYFQQVADVFKKHEARQKRLRLVMGACHAGSSIVPLRDLLPTCVTRYTAFQGEPSAGNVSEMVASVIGNKINLFKDIQDAIETGTVEHKSGMKPSEVLEQLVTPALDAHKDDPGRFIKGTNQGGYLFDFIRDKAGKWHEVYTSGEDGPTDRP